MLGLTVELRLEARQVDRVTVSVRLAPIDDAGEVEGVALQLLTPDDEPLGARMLLPIAGRVTQAIRSTVELRSVPTDIPQGSRILGTAWNGPDQLDVTIPTDPGTDFEQHVRGRVIISALTRGRYLELLLPDERAVIAHHLPWIDEPRQPRASAGALGVVDHEPETAEVVADLADELGLDDDSAEWLKSLLDEPE